MRAHVENKSAAGRYAELVMRVVNAANFNIDRVVDKVNILNRLAAILDLLIVFEPAGALESPPFLAHCLLHCCVALLNSNVL